MQGGMDMQRKAAEGMRDRFTLNPNLSESTKKKLQSARNKKLFRLGQSIPSESGGMGVQRKAAEGMRDRYCPTTRTTTSQKCAASPRRARIQGS